MKFDLFHCRFILVLVIFAGVNIFSCGNAFSQPRPTKNSPAPKSVFIIADGIPADVIEKLSLPALEAVGGGDGYKRAHVGGTRGSYSETPTISAPGYNDLLTGTWGNKHNVWDNDIASPNYHYFTIFRFFKDAFPGKKIAVFSTWADNRTKLVGDGLDATNSLAVDFPFDGYEKDTFSFPHDKSALYLKKIDRHVVSMADSVIRKNAPDLSWVYLEYTDDVGHGKGTGAAFDDAVRNLDDEIKTIAGAIQYRQTHFPERWQLIITTDHGRDAVTGKNHGGQSDRERTTWIITNSRQLNQHFRTDSLAIVDILPTIARHLQIVIPVENSRELDGVPMIGPVSVSQPQLFRQGDSLIVKWKALEKSGNVEIRYATTNHFREGGKDDYHIAGTAPVASGRFAIPLSLLKNSGFCKLVIIGKHNTVNSWFTK